MKPLSIFSLMVAVLAVGPGWAADAMSDRSKEAIERAVIGRFDEMVAAADARNADELFRNVAENDRGAVVLNGRLLRTRSDALQSVRENFRAVANVKYQIQERLVTVLSPTAALLIATGTVDSATLDGRAVSRPFVHSIVFVLQDGGWCVVHSHQSIPRPN
jgi:hypothetical protein